MRIFAIDSSDIYCRVAINDSHKKTPTFTCHQELHPFKQAENLLPIIKTFLEKQNINKNTLTAICTACGPGSFSGLRIGIATAKTLGLVLNIPVLGYENFELWHNTIKEKYELNKTLLIILQSKRDDIYAVAYKNNAIILPQQIAFKQDLQTFIDKSSAKIYLAGNMNEEFVTSLPKNSADKIEILPCDNFDLWQLTKKAKADITKNHLPKAQPIYLRLPQTSKAKKIWTNPNAKK